MKREELNKNFILSMFDEKNQTLLNNISINKSDLVILNKFGHLRNNTLFDQIKEELKKELNERVINFDKTLELINKYIGISETEKKLFGEVFTPFALIREMLDTLPKDVWSNPKLKWLDPANGCGNFPIIVVQRLMEGLKIWEPNDEKRYKHIMENMIYVCDISIKNMFVYLQLFDPKNEYKLNFFRGSFLDAGFDKYMKNVWGIDNFDIIVSNPPYQRGNSKTHKLWVEFLDKSKDISNYILFVNPVLICNGRSKRISSLRGSIINYMVSINLSKQDIFEVGEKVCYYLLNFTEKIKNTLVILENGKEQTMIFDDIICVSETDSIKNNIIKKIEKHEKIEWKSDIKNTDGNGAPNNLLSIGLIKETQDNIYKYKFHHSASNIFFSKEIMSYGKLKIAFNFSGGFFDKNDTDRYMIITDGIIGKQLESIEINDKEEGLKIRNLYSKNIFLYYIKSEKTGGFNTGIFKLPKLDWNKSWTDQELYDYFNLSKEEIDLIENTIKNEKPKKSRKKK